MPDQVKIHGYKIEKVKKLLWNNQADQ